jgi:hypothetical protein
LLRRSFLRTAAEGGLCSPTGGEVVLCLPHHKSKIHEF